MADADNEQDVGNGNGLILYYFPSSYYSQRVVIALHEKKLPFTTKLVNPLTMDQYQTWFLKLNPRAQVPVLQDGMKIVPDSNRIIEYLDDNFSNGSYKSLFPRDAEKEVKDKIEYYCRLIDSVPAFPMTFGSLFHSEHVSDPLPPLSLPSYREKMKKGLDKILITVNEVKNQSELSESLKSAIEDKQKKLQNDIEAMNDAESYNNILKKVGEVLGDVEVQLSSLNSETSWLCCEYFTVADIYLVVLLHRIRVLGLHGFLWTQQSSHPHIAKYYTRVSERESVQLATTLPDIVTKQASDDVLPRSSAEPSPTPASVGGCPYASSFSSDRLMTGICVGAALMVGLYIFQRK